MFTLDPTKLYLGGTTICGAFVATTHPSMLFDLAINLVFRGKSVEVCTAFIFTFLSMIATF